MYQMKRPFYGVFTAEDYLDMGHLEKLMDMGYSKMSPKKREKAAKAMLQQQRLDYLKDIEEYAEAEDWESVCCTIRLRPFIMEEAFSLFYPRIPDGMKYEFVTDIYTHNGDSCANIREALTHARDYGEPDLPEWMKDVITVYRGCSESAEEARWSISWTTEQDVAEKFANRNIFRFGQKGHVYKAKIPASEIIAFTNTRHEQEVMQYGSVYDIEEIPFIPGRVQVTDENGHWVPNE